jgi:hypothetical protein
MLNRGAACGDSGCRYVGAARREYTNRGFPKDVVGGLGSRFDDLGTAYLKQWVVSTGCSSERSSIGWCFAAGGVGPSDFRAR